MKSWVWERRELVFWKTFNGILRTSLLLQTAWYSALSLLFLFSWLIAVEIGLKAIMFVQGKVIKMRSLEASTQAPCTECGNLVWIKMAKNIKLLYDRNLLTSTRCWFHFFSDSMINYLTSSCRSPLILAQHRVFLVDEIHQTDGLGEEENFTNLISD